MSAPKIIVQVLIMGTQIFGKALYAAGQQAIKNAKTTPQALGGEITGVQNATTGSLTDKLTREHRLTLDEAHLILNSKREESLEGILERYEHLYMVNSPPEPSNASAATPASRRPPAKFYSHYLQSKVVRAKERIEAELSSSQASEPPPDSNPPPPSS